MKVGIRTALVQERSIFANFSVTRQLSRNCTAFATPRSNEVPHWNMVYPEQPGYRYVPEELLAARSFYSQQRVDPHVLVTGAHWEGVAAETAEYFYIGESRSERTPGIDVAEYSAIPDASLGQFCNVIARAFGLNVDTMDFFKSKMELLSKLEGTQFWIVKRSGVSCGSASTFRTVDGSLFLFNFAVLPEFQGGSVGSGIMSHLLSRTDRPMYTYSHNPVMREHLLPHAGFSSIGTIHVVPIDGYDRMVERE